MTSLEKALVSKGYDVVMTREPGGSALGETIRQRLLSHDARVKIGSVAELLLFLAARAQHIEELIAPALKDGKIVLCDRFNDSTVAYQSGARGLDSKMVRQLCDIVCGRCQPDLTLYLDVDPQVGMSRAKARSKDNADRIEAEELDFHHRVRKAFLSISEQESNRFKCLDGSQPKTSVLDQALEEINILLKRI